MTRRHPVFVADVRTLGGTVSIHAGADRIDPADRFYTVRHVSRGGDLHWVSPRIPDEDRAAAAAEVLADFVGAVVR